MTFSNEPNRPSPDEFHRRADRLDSELQADPELAEGPATGGRIGLFAVAIIAILGVVFFGLNNSATPPTDTASDQTKSAPANPGAINSAPGQTTGSASSPPPRNVTPAAPSQAPANN